MQKGSQSFKFDIPVYIEQTASVVGEKESEGPLGRMFDVVIKDPMSGKDNWEQAESALQEAVVDKLLMKTSYKKEQIRYILSGDLLGQLIATSFGISKYEIPHFGIYGACSTFGEALSLGALIISAGAADRLICMASSHFASAEKQFRFPLEYGNQRPKASTWTVTGSGAAVITNERQPVAITGITTGKIIDYGVKDSMNMGACMAPAAADLIVANFKDFETDEKYYDRIITGDLGTVGREILINLVKEKGYDISQIHMDCGIEIFDPQKQGTHAGGSGCGCSAVVFSSYIIDNVRDGKWKRKQDRLSCRTGFNRGKRYSGRCILRGTVTACCGKFPYYRAEYASGDHQQSCVHKESICNHQLREWDSGKEKGKSNRTGM